jgi:hypothetical protein
MAQTKTKTTKSSKSRNVSSIANKSLRSKPRSSMCFGRSGTQHPRPARSPHLGQPPSRRLKDGAMSRPVTGHR